MPKHYIAERDYSLEELLGEVVDEEAEHVMQQIVTDMFAIQAEAIASHYNSSIQAAVEGVQPIKTVVTAVKKPIPCAEMGIESWARVAASHPRQLTTPNARIRSVRNSSGAPSLASSILSQARNQTSSKDNSSRLKKKTHKG